MKIFLAVVVASFVTGLPSIAWANKYACSAKQVYQIEDNGTLSPINNYFLTLWGNSVIDASNGEIKQTGQAPQKWKIIQTQTPHNELVAANPNTIVGTVPTETIYLRDFSGKASTFRVYMLTFIVTGICQRI
jgi:hypothetical protein